MHTQLTLHGAALCVAPQCFASSTFSLGLWPHVCAAVSHYCRVLPALHCLGEAAPRECTVASPNLHTFSGQGSPAHGYYSVSLALHPLQVRKPLVYTARWVHEAAPCCTCWVSLQLPGPDALLFLLDLAQEGRLGMCHSALQVGHRSWMELLPAIQVHGNINKGTHWFLWSWVVPSAPGSPTSLWGPSFLLVAQKLFNWLMVFSQEELL